ncbi:hypothetical protein N0V88_005040 [Collariella sp. IMI 366227]|nr:hypothetical protein N0V88_005040 [Collariella sp. IMI 366227]
MSVTGDKVRMADVDGDGLADIISLYPNGAARLWKNVGGGRTFKALDSKWVTGLNERDKINMDGVDYVDYVVAYNGGAVNRRSLVPPDKVPLLSLKLGRNAERDQIPSRVCRRPNSTGDVSEQWHHEVYDIHNPSDARALL